MKIGINVKKKTPKIIQQSNIKNNYILFTTVDKQVGGRGNRRRHGLVKLKTKASTF